MVKFFPRYSEETLCEFQALCDVCQLIVFIIALHKGEALLLAPPITEVFLFNVKAHF